MYMWRKFYRDIVLIAGIFTLVAIRSAAAAEIQFQVDQFIIEGDNPIGQVATDKALESFIGEHSGIERLRQAASTLETEMNSKGYDFYRVTLPQQVLNSGAVVLEIRHLVVNEISTSGNKNFSDANILRSLPQLKQGQTPNTRSLSRALAIANFNTAKRTRLTFGRGSVEDTVDARIEVRDRSPQQFYGWVNNTGTEPTTRSRLGVGYQHRNLFDLDHGLTATYTTSPEDVEKVSQYGINYEVPVYSLTGIVGFFYVESDLETGRVADAFDVSGGGTTTGLRYSQVLNKLGDFRQRVYFDLTDKLFDNNVDFEGNDIGIDVRSRPLATTWQIEWDKLSSNGRANVTYAANLDGGDFNSQAAYSASRVGAPQDWQSFRVDFRQDFNIPNEWRVSLGLRGLYSDDPLISGEQLGLGGVYGPRGFEEREVSVDRGMNLQLEMWAPPTQHNLQFGGFVDHGFGTRLNPQPGEVRERNLTSIGIGGKWQWNNRLVLTMDYGYVLEGLEEPDFTQDGDSRIHASLVYRLSAE